MTDIPSARVTNLRPRSLRTRLTIVLTLSTLMVVAIVGIAATALSIWRADDPDAATTARAARVGDEIAVVVVAEGGADDAAAQARRDALGWMFVALGAAVVPALGVGWFISKRILGTIDDAVGEALAEVDAIELERRRRLDDVVHELRTPLAVAGTNLELAAADTSLDEDTSRLIDAARRAADRMRRTVDDLAEHGRLAVDRADTLDLAAEVRAVVAEQAGPARARALHVIAAGADTVEVPAGDRAAVHTALGNLAANAVRLAPRGSVITVSSGEHAGWAWAAVSDEGPGISDRLHAKVFERGWRGRHDRDRDRSSAPDQRGLGLTISRQLVEAHGGVLTVESDEGAGSTFTVWLPLTADVCGDDIVAADHLHPRVHPWRDDVATELRPSLA